VVTLANGMAICPDCCRDFRVRVSEDIAFHAYLDGRYYMIDVLLVFEKERKAVLLHSECYVLRD